MEFRWPENLPADRKKAIEELSRGREFANKLRNLINESLENNGSVMAEDLVVKVLNSFSNTLSMLKSGGESDEVSENPPCSDGRKSEDSGESSKSSTVLKDRRGCYKRRKTSHTWSRDSPTLIDDGHAWRKYGQKVILNAKYPRNYFRCTHKHDQQCQATKQVQMIEDDPPLYRTTYYGHHICKNLLKASEMILDSTANDSSTVLINFQSNTNTNAAANTNPAANTNNNKQDGHHAFFPSIKQEYKDEMIRPSDNLAAANTQYSSSSDYLLSHDDLTTFESSPGHLPVLPSDYGDVISGVFKSCTATTHSLDMSIVGSVHDFDVSEFEF